MRKCTTEEFIKKAKEVHGDRYIYNDTTYTGGHSKVTVICKIHGNFEQTASNHLKGSNCPECSGNKRITTEGFIEKAQKVHCGKYTYKNTVVRNNRDKVTITCSEHGDFEQKVNNHLSGKGCPKCYGNSKLTTEDFIEKSKAAHGSTYDYSKVLYTTARSKVTIGCPIHGEFKQSAFKHYSGQGCPDCATTGFDPSKPAVLYYLSILGGTAYKIGITNRTVRGRMDRECKSTYSTIKIWEFEAGLDAYTKEQEILAAYKASKYAGDYLLKSGNTELFSYDVLNLDTHC